MPKMQMQYKGRIKRERRQRTEEKITINRTRPIKSN